MGRVFFDINLTNVFLGQSPKAVEMKTKINKWILMMFTSFWTVKQTKNRQLLEWDKIFASDKTNLVTFKLMQSPRFILILSLFKIPFRIFCTHIKGSYTIFFYHKWNHAIHSSQWTTFSYYQCLEDISFQLRNL